MVFSCFFLCVFTACFLLCFKVFLDVAETLWKCFGGQASCLSCIVIHVSIMLIDFDIFV